MTVSTTCPQLPEQAVSASAELFQLLTADGERNSDQEIGYAGSLDQARELLEKMSLIRRFDLEATAAQRKGQIGLWAPLQGQEAIQVGVWSALTNKDHVFPSHREHGVGMLMGLPVERVLAIFKGAEMGDWDAEELRFHYYSMVIGAHTLHGVGYAMAQAKENPGSPGASIVFHGDGAISEGDVNEAYIFAASYKAPTVFVCVNNQWAISEPVSRQSRTPLYQRAWGFGIPSVRVDGNDVLAMQTATDWALARAHAGEGPSFIEAYTYRMGAHTTSDDPTKYRTDEDSQSWEPKDPIKRVQLWLRHENAWSDEDQQRLDARCDEFAETVRQAVLEIEAPKLPEMFDRVYVEQTENLRAQQAETALSATDDVEVDK
ncbi:hypothetical protein HMPREF9306_02068 [Propionimicrobium lymphophilum ACS-093-V-SCH5]|uniref:2-oxoisovalerate dehydrogenase subunit alpha n=1 Tax=Propionimicrobium lymphophilum ACS-093-V-SCH5 TaxID=883161 RepID=S2W033_9ACTN|nr:thiamine pyrophosphate-dependent enzyme [Propionimicrobium lymphophilum]EPD32496.1 hypothetical protein HMPREF9306_02068 [Propionimicrobium lymphophilum ACS-093-V-SCH5]